MKKFLLLFIGVFCLATSVDARVEYQSKVTFSKDALNYSKSGFFTEGGYKQNSYKSGKPLQRNIVKTLYKRTKSGEPQPLTTISNNIMSTNNLYFNQIAQVERSIYGRTFDNQNVNARLERLEHSVFNRTYPTLSYEQRVNNLIMNYNSNVRPNNISSNSSDRDLNGLEQRVFNRTFVNENPQSRMSRLEQQVFGASQSGELADRIGMLRQATTSYTPQMASYPCTAPMISTGGGWRGALGSLGNLMMMNGGMPTGLTPQIDPNYMDYMDPGYSRGVTSNRGWGYNRYQNGSGSKVTILD